MNLGIYAIMAYAAGANPSPRDRRWRLEDMHVDTPQPEAEKRAYLKAAKEKRERRRLKREVRYGKASG